MAWEWSKEQNRDHATELPFWLPVPVPLPLCSSGAYTTDRLLQAPAPLLALAQLFPLHTKPEPHFLLPQSPVRAIPFKAGKNLWCQKPG